MLQHANNPVDWYPWSQEILAKAKAENKLILVSIGYSACHWCHVMEHESFEDEEIAAVMNEHFICIKVDREERPDIDTIYMTAVQLVTGSGGWPLNCFTLPDGKPFYGGTYFRKADWLQILKALSEAWINEPQKITKYAEDLSRGITSQEELKPDSRESPFSIDELSSIANRLVAYYDLEEGGTKGSPKFPLPPHYEFMLHYWWSKDFQPAAEITTISLDKMGQGGIYDHLGGGFARYSVDAFWQIPHFEKMLYDNAQLISIYSKACQLTGREVYKKIACHTATFVLRDLRSPDGAFFSAYDSDSEGEEGKFYTWQEEEIDNLLGTDSSLFKKFYRVTKTGNWEKTNILFHRYSVEEFAGLENLDAGKVSEVLDRCRKILFQEREKRIKPLLDDKVITAWNGLMIKALCDVARATGRSEFGDAAMAAAEFALNNLLKSDNSLFRTFKNGTGKINGFLDDYAFLIEAFIAVYELSFMEKYIGIARGLLEYTLVHFYNSDKGMFWYTSDLDARLVARTTETTDSVIPSSNSVMAFNLFRLGHFFGESQYIYMSEKMGHTMQAMVERSPINYMNWMKFYLTLAEPFYELAVTGPGAYTHSILFQRLYHPSLIMAAAEKESNLPFLKGRINATQCRFFVCRNHICEHPAEEPGIALAMLGRNSQNN